MSHNKIEQSENQLAPAKAKPEDFTIEKYDTKVSVTGQESNEPEAEAKSHRKPEDSLKRTNYRVRSFRQPMQAAMVIGRRFGLECCRK